MAKSPELSFGAETLQGPALPHRGVVLDVVEELRVEDEEAAIDPRTILARFFLELRYRVALERKTAEAIGNARRGDRGEAAMSDMKPFQGGKIDVGEHVAVSHQEV